jgi:hypothetical protein
VHSPINTHASYFSECVYIGRMLNLKCGGGTGRGERLRIGGVGGVGRHTIMTNFFNENDQLSLSYVVQFLCIGGNTREFMQICIAM